MTINLTFALRQMEAHGRHAARHIEADDWRLALRHLRYFATWQAIAIGEASR